MKDITKWSMLHTHERIAGNSFGELLFHFSKMLLTEAGKSAMMFVANDPSLVLWLEPMLTTLLYAWSAAGATEHWLSSLGVTWLNRQDLIHHKKISTNHQYNYHIDFTTRDLQNQLKSVILSTHGHPVKCFQIHNYFYSFTQHMSIKYFFTIWFLLVLNSCYGIRSHLHSAFAISVFWFFNFLLSTIFFIISSVTHGFFDWIQFLYRTITFASVVTTFSFVPVRSILCDNHLLCKLLLHWLSWIALS